RRRYGRTLAALSEALDWPADHLDAVLAGRPTPEPAIPAADDPVLEQLRAIREELAGIKQRLRDLEAALGHPARGPRAPPTAPAADPARPAAPGCPPRRPDPVAPRPAVIGYPCSSGSICASHGGKQSKTVAGDVSVNAGHSPFTHTH